MKKIVSLLFVLMLCLTAAFAEAVPSKTTGDMTRVEVAGENIPADSNFTMAAVVSDAPEYQEKIQACENEIAVLAASESVATYFGVVKSASGEAVDLTEVLGTQTLNVHEFCPFVVNDYEESYGNVKATMQFATPYEAGEKVVVLIGIVTVNAAGIQTVEWFAFEGVGVGTEGGIEVELDSNIISTVQSGNALMAVVSK